jgi:SWI/SNF-related matrix-associated actin-dependent regulator 1 of chromatin subfamily A
MIHPSAELVLINFGKYNGYSLSYVCRVSPAYLQWVANDSTLPEIWKTAARKTLAGEDISNLDLPRKKESSYTRSGVPKSTVAKIYFVSKKIAAIEMSFDRSKMEQFKFEIDGRAWNADEKRWEFPIVHLPKIFEVFNDWEIKCDQNVIDVKNSLVIHREQLDEIREKEDTDFDTGDLLLPLFPFQSVGVEFIDKAGGRALIADQPGLGKTVQAIAYARLHKLKTLVICPKSVVLGWKKEIEKFTGLSVCIWADGGHVGRTNCQFHLSHYDAVRKISDQLYEQKYDLLVCDEAVLLKNRNTLRTKNILGDWKQRLKYPGIQTKHVLFLTGTPVLNRPIEAFTLLHFLDKQRFSNFFHFVQRYGGWKSEPAKNLLDLHERTKDLVIRRLKVDVLPELPPKLPPVDLYIELTPAERKQYKQLLEELFGKWRLNQKPSIGTMSTIQLFLAEKKLPRVIELIDEYVDSELSILIYSSFKEPLYRLKEHYGDNAVLYTGDVTNKDERERLKMRLVRGEAKIGLFTLGAGGVGIDGLQHAMHNVVFLNIAWTPAEHEQAEDRLHRILQKNAVQPYYIMVEDTIDDAMKETIREKQEIIDLVVDGALMAPVRKTSFFKDFVKRISKQYNVFFGEETE